MMKNRIFTGNYHECKVGNLISISGDRGKKVGFKGKAIPQLAPKKGFWTIYDSNIGKIDEDANNRYYIQEYYKQVLSKVDIQELLKNEKDPILLCYEKNQNFCHRHILAEYIALMYDKEIKDIKIDENLNIEENARPNYIRPMLERTIIENILIPEDGKINKDDINAKKGLILKIIPELKDEDDFDPKNIWHIFDVWVHTLTAVSNAKNDLEIRLALLLHDIGKQKSYYDDRDVRHFKGYAEKSVLISRAILQRLGYSKKEIERICYLIKNYSSIINVEEIN